MEKNPTITEASVGDLLPITEPSGVLRKDELTPSIDEAFEALDIHAHPEEEGDKPFEEAAAEILCGFTIVAIGAVTAGAIYMLVEQERAIPKIEAYYAAKDKKFIRMKDTTNRMYVIDFSKFEAKKHSNGGADGMTVKEISEMKYGKEIERFKALRGKANKVHEIWYGDELCAAFIIDMETANGSVITTDGDYGSVTTYSNKMYLALGKRFKKYAEYYTNYFLYKYANSEKGAKALCQLARKIKTYQEEGYDEYPGESAYFNESGEGKNQRSAMPIDSSYESMRGRYDSFTDEEKTYKPTDILEEAGIDSVVANYYRDFEESGSSEVVLEDDVFEEGWDDTDKFMDRVKVRMDIFQKKLKKYVKIDISKLDTVDAYYSQKLKEKGFTSYKGLQYQMSTCNDMSEFNKECGLASRALMTVSLESTVIGMILVGKLNSGKCILERFISGKGSAEGFQKTVKMAEFYMKSTFGVTDGKDAAELDRLYKEAIKWLTEEQTKKGKAAVAMKSSGSTTTSENKVSTEDELDDKANTTAKKVSGRKHITEAFDEPSLDELFIEAADIDEDMKPIIKKLNRKGYKTLYSCSGHPSGKLKSDQYRDGIKNGKLYSTARVVFKKQYAAFKSVPEGWEPKDCGDGKFGIYVKGPTYNIINGMATEQFYRWKKRYMYHLEKWVDDLPDNGANQESDQKSKKTAPYEEGSEYMESLLEDVLMDACDDIL